MNFAAEQLNCGATQATPCLPDERRCFVEWRRAVSEEHEAERYPPRALVGRYLADGLARMRLPRRATSRSPRATAGARARAARFVVDDRGVRRCRARWLRRGARGDRSCDVPARLAERSMAPRRPVDFSRLPGHAARAGADRARRDRRGPWLRADVPRRRARAHRRARRRLRAGRPSVPAALHGLARRRRHDPAVLAHRTADARQARPVAGGWAYRRWRRSRVEARAQIRALPDGFPCATACCRSWHRRSSANLLAASRGEPAAARPQAVHAAARSGWRPRATADRAANVADARRGDRALARGRCRTGRARSAVGARTHVARRLSGPRHAPQRRRAASRAVAGVPTPWRLRWSASPSGRPPLNAAKLLALIAAGRVDLGH